MSVILDRTVIEKLSAIEPGARYDITSAPTTADHSTARDLARLTILRTLDPDTDRHRLRKPGELEFYLAAESIPQPLDYQLFSAQSSYTLDLN